jgi:hypothetical protein
MNIMSGPGAIMARKTAATYSTRRCVFTATSSHHRWRILSLVTTRRRLRER